MEWVSMTSSHSFLLLTSLRRPVQRDIVHPEYSLRTNVHCMLKENAVTPLSCRLDLGRRQQGLASHLSKRMGGSQLCWSLLVLFELWKPLRADTLVPCY